jgi:hypothetical protein
MTLFTTKINSIVDIITNSSSELFVGNKNSKEELIELIKEVYPNYLDEYHEIQSLNEIRNDDFTTYLSYKYYSWDDDLILSKTYDIKPEILYSNWEERNTKNYWYPRLSDKGIKLIKNKIDPNNKLFFLFSMNDNPNYEMQIELERIMTRYHLG